MSQTYAAGDLTERVAIKRKTQTRDGMGGAVDTVTTVDTVWALVRPLSGRERVNAERLEARADYLVVIRYHDEVRDTDYLEWRGRELNIRFRKSRGPISPWLELECEMGATS